MVCKLFYSSEYINGCNISKFGEGCEKCIPLFKSEFMFAIFIVGICALILFILTLFILNLKLGDAEK